MRILQRRGGARDTDLVAADFLHQRFPLGLAGEHVQRSMRGQRHEAKYGKYCLHRALLESVRAMRAQAEDVLQQDLVVGHAGA